MKFDIIATQEHSRVDFSALLAFGSPEHARISTKAINDSPWANTQCVTLGQSGAFQVGSHVMFNTYGEYACWKIIDMLKNLTLPATERDLYSSMWNSLVDPDAPYSEARDFAILFFTKVLPGATAEATGREKDEMEHKFTLSYRGAKFTAVLKWECPVPRIMFFTEGNMSSSHPDFSIYEDTEDIRKIFDDTIEGTVDRDGHFPEDPRESREPPGESQADSTRQALEDRVASLETLMAGVQEEIKEIKKKL